jgi:ABC-2 type transport system permease protein
LLVATYWDFTNQIGDAAYRSDKKVLKYYEDQIKTTKDSSDAKDINQHIDQLKAMIKSYDEYKVNPKAWKERLKNEIKGLENTKSGNEGVLSKETNFEQLNYDKYLLQNNFKPQQDFVATSFEFNDAYLQIIGIFVIIIFIIVAIMTSDIISSEYTPPTIKFLLLRPVSEWKLIVGKFLACAVSAFALIATCDMVVYIFGGIKYAFTNLMYPVAIGQKFKYSSIMDVHLNQFISVIPNTSTVVPYYKFLLVISKLPSFQKVSNIMGGVFIFLGDSNAIISRSFVQQYGASYIGTMSAVIIMLIWTGVFMGLSLLTTRFSWK